MLLCIEVIRMGHKNTYCIWHRFSLAVANLESVPYVWPLAHFNCTAVIRSRD